ncbi:unnamed protein product [Arctogadus glacialis]
MDVRFYPAHPGSVGSCSLPADPSCLSSLDYYHANKFFIEQNCPQAPSRLMFELHAAGIPGTAYKRKTEAAKKEYLKALAAYRASLVSKTYNDPEPKSAQQNSQSSPHLLPPKQPLYSVPPQSSSPYMGPPGAFPLSDLQSFGGPPRHALARTLSQSQMLPPSMSASPPSPFQISPPLHPHAQLSLHSLNQPIRMQQVQTQPIISHQMGLHSPPLGQQGFSHIQADYPNSVGGPQSPGAPNPGQNPDWEAEYCNRDCGPNHCSSGMGPRDKSLYLT